MKNCSNCYWCQVSFSSRKRWKCKNNPKKRFNNNKIHGTFCSSWTHPVEDLQEELNSKNDFSTLKKSTRRGRVISIILGCLIGSITVGIIVNSTLTGLFGFMLGLALSVSLFTLADWWGGNE